MCKMEDDVINIVYVLAVLGLIGLVVLLGAVDQNIAEAWLEQGYKRGLSVSHSSVRGELESLGCDMTRSALFAQDLGTGQTVVLIGSPNDYDICTAPSFELLQSMELEQKLKDVDDAAAAMQSFQNAVQNTAMGAGIR